MFETFAWWLSIEVVGLAALPLTVHMFRFLPDRGLAFCRPFGLLLVSYTLWICATFGFLRNDRGAIVVICIVIGAICWWYWGREAVQHLAGRTRLLILNEVLFAGCLALWALVRAFDPSIAGTEKPMEFAFINAILRTDYFPPPDPWMSGYSISYYYFGYVMMALLTKLSDVPSQLVFGLIGALLFALTASGVFSLGYNLAVKLGRKINNVQSDWGDQLQKGPLACGLAATGLVVVMGNLVGLLELLNAHNRLSTSVSGWLNIRDFPPPYQSPSWLPSEHWWWWRATRVIGTVDPATGASLDYTISEFPWFSFILGDIHPHVLSLPFVVLALALAFQALLSPIRPWWQHRRHTLIIGLCLGALGFLNTWDMPLLILIYLAAYAASRFIHRPILDLSWFGQIFSYGLMLSILAIGLYAPFYITFASQAAGIGVVLTHSSLAQFLLIWAPMLTLAGAYLGIGAWRWAKGGLALPVGAVEDKNGYIRPEFIIPPLGVLIAGLAVLWIVSLLFIAGIPVLAALTPGLAVGMVLAIRWFSYEGPASPDIQDEDTSHTRLAHFFLILLILMALVLLSFCEVAFLRDLFGNRMNTVFKFYYQAWLLLGIAGAGVLYYLANMWRSSTGGWRWAGLAGGVIVGLVLAGAAVYPVTALFSKSGEFRAAPTIDGLARYARQYPAEYAAIRWLHQNAPPEAVVLEASGGSYSQFGRISMSTGIPTLLGWDFHQRQWRGRAIDGEVNARKSAIESVYRVTSSASNILRQYRVTHIFVGGLERDAFLRNDPNAETRLRTLGEVVFQQDNVFIIKIL